MFVYGGWPFLQGAWRELRDRLPGMMTLISLAITVAFVFSVAVTLGFVAGMHALVGAGDARRDHAARPLDRDALDLAGAGRAEGAGQAAARHGRASRGRGRQREEVPVAELQRGRSACSSGPARAFPPTASCAKGRARSTNR